MAIFSFSPPPNGLADEVVLTEDRLKALWVYNFAKFVDWPPHLFRSADQPFVIGVIGRESLANELSRMTREEKIKNRSIRIRCYTRTDDVSASQIVFVSGSETGLLQDLNRVAQAQSILTVGESADFVARGGMMTLRLVSKQIRCVMNLQTIAAASLVPRAKLVSLKQVEQVQDR